MTPAKPHRTLYHPEDDRPVPAALFWVLFLGLLAIAVTAIAVALVGAWT